MTKDRKSDTRSDAPRQANGRGQALSAKALGRLSAGAVKPIAFGRASTA